MPLQNMDCWFQLEVNTFTVGAVSPLNSGWYLALPDLNAYKIMKEKAIWRLMRDWDPIFGWKETMPPSLSVRGGKPVGKWEFNGADMDQGLLTHIFIINQGKGMLVDTVLKTAKLYEKGLIKSPEVTLTFQKALSCCRGHSPLKYFAHFTGKDFTALSLK